MQNEQGMNVKRQRMFDEGKEEEEAVSGIPIRGDYNDDDILQGRGKGVSRHRGNRRFRKIIKRHCNAYTRAKNNRERRKIVDLVLGEVHNRGRFLELSSDSHWVMLTEKKIREKVSQVRPSDCPFCPSSWVNSKLILVFFDPAIRLYVINSA